MTALAQALRAHQLERSRELTQLALLLEQEGLSTNVGPLRAAASQCLAPPRTAGPEQPDAGAVYWGYEFDGLPIDLEEQRHCRPRTAVTQPASGTLSVRVEEYVPTALNEVGDSWAHIRRLDAEFYLDVHQLVAGVRHPLRSAWHVDTHLHVDEDSHAVHPRFHFQVGGERLDPVDADIRAVFVPEAPRMPCAPLDAILAFDFVLSHYAGEAWAVLQGGEPRYRRLRAAPMQRYWQPYYQTISDAILALPTTPGGGAGTALLPNICLA